jgi:hypothetical protein
MLYVGRDLSRKRPDWRALDGDANDLRSGAVPPDVDGLRGRVRQVDDLEQPVRGKSAEAEKRTGRRRRSAPSRRFAALNHH